MKKIILILALIFSCGLIAQTKIYEIQNKGKGVISELTPANLLLIKETRPYKVYTALLNQSGTNAPTATVLENTL